jgi:hypothetical protein
MWQLGYTGLHFPESLSSMSLVRADHRKVWHVYSLRMMEVRLSCVVAHTHFHESVDLVCCVGQWLGPQLLQPPWDLFLWPPISLTRQEYSYVDQAGLL